MVGQSGSPSASLTKKSIVSGVISASNVPKVTEFSDPIWFSKLDELCSSNKFPAVSKLEAQQLKFHHLWLCSKNKDLGMLKIYNVTLTHEISLRNYCSLIKNIEVKEIYDTLIEWKYKEI